MSNHAIFMVFDDAYEKYTRVCLNSMERNYPDHPTVLAYYDGEDKAFKKYLRSINNLKLIPYEEDTEFVSGLRLHEEINVSKVYHRYKLWTSLYDEYDSIVHLDADTLILRPFDEIFELPTFFITPNHEMWPMVRVFPEGSEQDTDLMNLLQEDELPYPGGIDDMANAGVFMIPKSMRMPHAHNTLVEITERYNKWLQFADQSAISLWCHKLKIPFSPRHEYDFQMPIYRDKNDMVPKYGDGYGVPAPDSDDMSFISNIKILHFSSPRKPGTKDFAEWPEMGSLANIMADMYGRYL